MLSPFHFSTNGLWFLHRRFGEVSSFSQEVRSLLLVCFFTGGQEIRSLLPFVFHRRSGDQELVALLFFTGGQEVRSLLLFCFHRRSGGQELAVFCFLQEVRRSGACCFLFFTQEVRRSGAGCFLFSQEVRR
jgi:hypothetical protein